MSPLSYRTLFIGTAPAGLIGLDELLRELYQAGVTPDATDLDDKLIAGIKRNNYVPRSAHKDYALALRSEFTTYHNALKQGKTPQPRNYGTWEGHPREHIPWFPAIAEELCNGCGACIEVCPKNVFKKTADNKVIVVDPFDCIVGCCFCKSPCLPKAIMMPDRTTLDYYRHQQGMR